ncbi:MAG: hypothetical protein GC136_09430 [Alphaproteobacteria bacterium]|nr:hypothetical protein [Alphaproteobacteria bacterium]
MGQALTSDFSQISAMQLLDLPFGFSIKDLRDAFRKQLNLATFKQIRRYNPELIILAYETLRDAHPGNDIKYKGNVLIDTALRINDLLESAEFENQPDSIKKMYARKITNYMNSRLLKLGEFSLEEGAFLLGDRTAHNTIAQAMAKISLKSPNPGIRHRAKLQAALSFVRLKDSQEKIVQQGLAKLSKLKEGGFHTATILPFQRPA